MLNLNIPRSLLRGSPLVPSCFRGVFEIKFYDTPQLAAGSFISLRQGRARRKRGLVHRHDVTTRTGIASSVNRFTDHIPRLVPQWVFC